MSPTDWLPPSLCKNANVRDIASGQFLFHQGERVEGIFEVLEGRLRQFSHAVDGRDVVMHIARQGTLIVESALFSDTYQCSVVALAPSRVRAFGKDAFLEALRAEPALAEKFMSVLAEQVRQLRATLETRNFRTARERIVHFLAVNRGPDSQTLRLDGTLKDLADDLGITHESLYRTLAQLANEGVIERTPNSIILKKSQPV